MGNYVGKAMAQRLTRLTQSEIALTVPDSTLDVEPGLIPVPGTSHLGSIAFGLILAIPRLPELSVVVHVERL